MKKGIKIILITIGMLLSMGISAYSVMAQEVTETPTASPMGTLTPFPTNTTPTPGDGSGCPANIPTLMQGAYYQKCKICWEGSNDPIKTSTPTATKQYTDTPTLTPTTVADHFYWVNNNDLITNVSVNGAGTAIREVTAPACYGSDKKVINYWETDNRAYFSKPTYSWFNPFNSTTKKVWEPGYGAVQFMNNYTKYTSSNPFGTCNNGDLTCMMNWLNSNLPNSSAYAQIRVGQYGQAWGMSELNQMATTSTFLMSNNGDGSVNSTWYIRAHGLCWGVGTLPTATPTVTVQPTKVCIANESVKCVSNMDTFNNGLVKVGDGKISYYRIFPYDVGSYRSVYERDFYNKNFYVEMDVSGSTSFEFVETEPEVPVFYGPHKITGYDCSNNIIFENTLGPGASAIKGWTYPKSSICKVQVQTIDDGLEKQFSSDGVIVNGCEQLNCDSEYSGYTFDPNAKFGFNPGGWNDTVCNLIFPGVDLEFMKEPLDTVFEWVTGDKFQLDIPTIPYINICVHSWELPEIRFMDLDIPIGNILIIALVPILFRAIGGTKK